MISLSLYSTFPESAFTKPVMQLMRVVFPDPLGPMIPKTSPSSTSKLTSRSAWMPPKDFDKSLIGEEPLRSHLYPPLELMVFSLGIDHDPFAPEHDEYHQDHGMGDDSEGSERS